jgi:hypothetical protein
MSKPHTLFPINFSSSMLDDVHRCEMFFFRKHCQKIVSHVKDPDLIAGGIFAKACELVRKAYHNENIDEESAIDIGYEYILEAEDTRHFEKTNEQIAFALKRYFRRFPLDSNMKPVELVDGAHAIEYDFLIDLGIPHPDIPDQNINLRGKLDGLYRTKVIGRSDVISVLDEKTTKSLYRLSGTKLVDLSKEEMLYRTNKQFLIYHYIARQLGVNTTNTLIRKVPIGKVHEDAIELNIAVNQFMIDMAVSTMLNKIEELVDKYKYYKSHDDFPYVSFYPVLNDKCNDYSKPCLYSDGCYEKLGERALIATHGQRIWDSSTRTEVELIEYKRKLGIINE